MSRLFISHSSANNAEAVALRDWLTTQGWGDLFLDLDPDRGISAGERWEQALNENASRCEVVLFLVSKAWLGSRWCLKEFNLARRLNKRLLGALIEDLPIADLPADLAGNWQLVWLASGRDHVMLRAILPVTHEEAHVTFSVEGLRRLKYGLERAGLEPKYFAWPPSNDPSRPPYRGLLPLEADDAGIFFGRDAAVIEALDRLRGLCEAAQPRLLVVLGASGAGKSSFLRAGLFPRLVRDDRHFLPLPIIRTGRAAISSESGLLRALEQAFEGAKIKMTRADLRAAVAGGAERLRPLLQDLVVEMTPPSSDGHAKPRPPTLVMSIDQGEELFLAEAQQEAQAFLSLLRELLLEDAPALIGLITIRSDSYERLQLVPELDGVRQETFGLPPIPRGSYAEVIKGPVRRLEESERPLKIDDGLVDTLLADIEAGGAKDALPLLAFTLERLYAEYHAGGRLKLSHYDDLGRIKGSIEAAVERSLAAADADSRIPRDRAARLLLLRRGLIPWLAGIDPETGSPRRRVARLSEIPAEARALIDLLKEQRLLATDVDWQSREITIEPAHETLLRQWGLLQDWLAEDSGLLALLEGVKRASRDWAGNARDAGWLIHADGRLAAAERLRQRPDLAANFESTDWDYLAACRKREQRAIGRRRRVRAAAAMLCAMVIAALVYSGWSNRSFLNVYKDVLAERIWPKVLSVDGERAKKPGEHFFECAPCPVMVVVPAGSFMMGSPAGEATSSYNENERPQRQVTIASRLAVARFELTFGEWEACVLLGGCSHRPWDKDWDPNRQPVINVTWDDAQQYVSWLRKRTGKPYRLLTEAEWEYAARAGSQSAYAFGDSIVKRANCHDCGGDWDNIRAAPVGSFAPNAFGLYDMHGNVWEWVADCYQERYGAASADGSAVTAADCRAHVLRGGSWYNYPRNLRSAVRNFSPSVRSPSRHPDQPDTPANTIGFRVARTLSPIAP